MEAVEKKFRVSKKVQELQAIKIVEFLSMSQDDQAIVLIEYAKAKNIVYKYSSKYNNATSNTRLEKENFQGLLSETITRVLIKVNQYNNINSLNKNPRKMKSDKTKEIDFKSMAQVYGYLTNAFKNNVLKNYTPEFADKRKHCKEEISLSQPHSSTIDSDSSSSLIDSYGASYDFIEEYDNQTIMRDVSKCLMDFDQKNNTQYLPILNDYLRSGGNAADVSKSFKIKTHQINQKLKDIYNILDPELAYSFKLSLMSSMEIKSKNEFEIKYKENEKIDNNNFNNRSYELTESHGMVKGSRQIIISILEKNYSSTVKKETLVFNLGKGKNFHNTVSKHEKIPNLTIFNKNIKSKPLPSLEEKESALDLIKKEVAELKLRYAIS